MHKLLDVTDRSIRRLQLAAMGGSGLLLGVAGAVTAAEVAPAWASAVAFVVGLAGLVVAGGVRQRWEMEYRGHEIRFENSPLTGERLFLDGGLVSRGGIGQKMELRAPIRVGEGAGEEIMALVDAGVLQLRLRLYVEGAGEPPAAHPPRAESGAAPAVLSPPPPVVAAVTHTGALGGLVMARRAIEFAGSLITVVTTASAVLLWLLRGT